MPSNDAHFSGEGHLIEAEISGDPNNTVRPLVCDSTGHLLVAGGSTSSTVMIEDTAGNPITTTAGSLNVNVTGGGSSTTNLTEVGGAPISEGQKTSANSVPVVIASDQSAIPVTGTVTTSPNVNVHDGSGNTIGSTGTSLNVDVTNTVPVTGTFFQATQPVSGTVTVVQPTGTNLHTVVDSGTITLSGTSPVSGTVTANQGTPAVVANAWPIEVTDGTLVTGPLQTISGTNYIPVVLAASGTNGSAVPSRTIQIGGSDGTNIRTIKTSATGVVSVDGSAVTQPVSGTVAVTQSTTPWTVEQSSTLPVTIATVGITAASSGDNTVIAGVAGKKIYVFAWNISFSGTVNAKFTDGAAGTLVSGLYYGIVNAGGGNAVTPPYYLWSGTAGNALVLNLSAAVAVGGSVSYWQV